MIAAGVLSGLLAAVIGAIDYLAIPPGTRAKRVAGPTGVGNVVVVVLFAASWLLRAGEPGHVPTAFVFVLALVGAGLAAGTGWPGGSSSTFWVLVSTRTPPPTRPRRSPPGSGLRRVDAPRRSMQR